MQLITHSEQETRGVAMKLAESLHAGDVVAFEGELGAGKTAFTRGLVLGLGSPAPVSSPTFAIMNAYVGGRLTLYHFDLYRIHGEDDLAAAGFYDCLDDSGAALAVEWSENALSALPVSCIRVRIETLDQDVRRITITSAGRGSF